MKLKLHGWRAPASPAPSSIFRHPRTPRFRGARPPPPPHRPPCQRGTGDTRRRPQLCGRLLWGDPQVSPAHPAAQVSKEGGPCGVGGRRPGERGPSRAGAGCELGTRAQASVALRLPSGLQRARGPPGRLFPGSQPGPPPS